jgi:intergrase/recombinase
VNAEISIRAYLQLLVIFSSSARVRNYYHLLTATFDNSVHTVKYQFSLIIEGTNKLLLAELSIRAYLHLLVILSSSARVRNYYHLLTATFDSSVHTVKYQFSLIIERTNKLLLAELSIRAYLYLLVILSSSARVRNYYHLLTATFDNSVYTVKY